MTNEKLQELCDEWRDRLGMKDWRIKAEFVPSYSIGDLSPFGTIKFYDSEKNAWIRIVYPDQRPSLPTGDIPSTESILVHELIESKVCQCAPYKEFSDTTKEQEVNAITRALLSLKGVSEFEDSIDA